MKAIYSSVMRRALLTRLSILLGFIFVASSWASAAPVNDNFASAQAISGSSGFFVGSNLGATKEANEPNHAQNRGGASVWYKFVSPSNGVLNVNTAGSGIDTLVGIYIGNLNSLVRLTDSDFYSSQNEGSIWGVSTIGTKTGVTYYIAIDGKNKYDGTGAATGNFNFSFTYEDRDTNDNFAGALPLATGGSTQTWSTSNVGATKEAGEPNHLGNLGGKSVWYKFYNNSLVPRQIYLSLDSVANSYNGSSVKTLLGVYTGSSVNALTPVLTNGAQYYTNQRFTFLAQPGITYHIAVDGYNANDGFGPDTGTFTLTYGVAKDTRDADFDMDGRADLTVFRPSTGAWYSIDSGTQMMRAIQWGTSGDKPLVQRVLDEQLYTVFRPGTGIWYRTTNASQYSASPFGTNGDIPLIKNYRNSSGVTSSGYAVFRPSTGTWWIQTSPGGYAVAFGQQGDIPVSADFDGDGNDELAVFRPSNGMWYQFNQTTNQYKFIQFGLNGDKPVVADYDADGIADIGVYRPSNGVWYVIMSKTNEILIKAFGQVGDIPQAADYDNDGAADLAVYRNGTWWTYAITTGNVKAIQWGVGGDVPVSAPMN